MDKEFIRIGTMIHIDNNDFNEAIHDPVRLIRAVREMKEDTTVWLENAQAFINELEYLRGVVGQLESRVRIWMDKAGWYCDNYQKIEEALLAHRLLLLHGVSVKRGSEENKDE